MTKTQVAQRADPSSFYRLNEEIAAEVRRLEEAGALAPLQELLRAGGQELLVASVRRTEGLEELVGVLGPATGIPVTGIPVTGIPVTGIPVTGLPVTGIPVTGLPVTGLPVTGLPVTGLPVAGAGPRSAAPAVSLPPAIDSTGEVACDCGPGGEEAEPAAKAGPRPGWDAESFLATRSRFTALFPDGEARELYMPDHVCPLCLNDEANWIEDCGRACAACDFRW